MIDFTEEQIQRYSRHILLQDVGVEGQEKIMNARVLVVGAGGLGAPVSLYLAAAGIGTIGIVDADVVDLSNLQRQVIHFTKDVGVPKVKSAEEKIKAINPDVKVETYYKFLDSSNALDIIKEYDFIVDGTDNFPVKFLINDACVMAGKPFSHGGILRFNGQTFTHLPGTACYRCMFKEPPPAGAVPTCSQAGVLGAIAGMLGTIQAAETLKYFTGIGELLTNRLLTFDAKTMQFRTVPVRQARIPLSTISSTTNWPPATSKTTDKRKRSMFISNEIIDALISQAQQDAPNETCGYLLGISGEEGDVVTENYWMENIDHSPEHFSFAPKDQFAALKYARSKGLKILANWHSHPASPSRPSQEDLRLANDPTIRYAILSLHEGVHLNSFKILNGEVVDKEVHL